MSAQQQMLSVVATKVCARCGAKKAVEDFHFLSRERGVRRRECGACTADLRAMRSDRAWRPTCAGCGARMDSPGPGRRLCEECFDALYEVEGSWPTGRKRARLNPCSCCGFKRLRADHVSGGSLCGICREAGAARRRSLAKYGMTPRHFLVLLEHQRYRCAICTLPFTRSRVPHVDHRHADPSIVRGLLCASCNTLLGVARDEIERLSGAAVYLGAPPAQRVFPGLMALPEANRKGSYAPLKRVWTDKPKGR